MKIDPNSIVEAGVWGISLGLLIFSCSKDWRKASLSFIFMQQLTWPLGILAVELGAVEYPVRFFSHTISTSFTYEFLALPAVGSVFCVCFPFGRRRSVKAAYILAYPTALTVGEVILLHNTDLVRYIHWNWMITWLSITVTLLIHFRYFHWFFNPARTLGRLAKG
ncbi:CBO0543 family protein [Gorillibacterium sp. sgz5001074]|uniref:CBO0543 family protein n=1 Tax=Gorillibacterium sp. sgz5001074 TaxID=3446695 RepID=UPI003F680712